MKRFVLVDKIRASALFCEKNCFDTQMNLIKTEISLIKTEISLIKSEMFD